MATRSQSFQSQQQPPPQQHSHDVPLRFRKSRFLLFLFSALPGLNYMYLGLMKRGLFFLTFFFVTTILIRETRIGILGFGVFMLMCFCLFDAFRIRRLMRDGFDAPDSIDDVIAFYKGNKKATLLLFVILIAIGIVRRSVAFLVASAYESIAFATFVGTASTVATFILWLSLIILICFIITKVVSKKGNGDN